MHTYYLLHIISNGYVLFSIMDCIEFLERSNIESPPITCIPKVGISLDWPFFKSELKIIYHKSNSFYVRLKSYDFEVEIGSMTMVLDKLLRLKVFCAYQNNNELEKKYKLISLKFKNQIVGS